MLEKILNKSTALFKKPFYIFVIFIILTFILLSGFLNIKLDNEITHFVPESNKAKEKFVKYEKIFGNSSLIFIGIENPSGIYNTETFQYIKYLTDKVKELNSILPVKNISKFLKVSPDTAQSIIEIISTSAVFDENELKKILTDKEILINEYYLDKSKAETITKKIKKVNISDLLKAYETPLKDVLSIVNSDYIYGENERFILKKLLPDEEVSETNIKIAKQRIAEWDIYKNAFVSEDETLTTILIQLKEFSYPYRAELYKEIKKIITESKPSNLNIYFSGEPVIADSISEYMVKDVKVMVPIVFIVLLLVLYISFKNFSGVFYPMISVIISVLWTIGFMSLLNIPLNLLTTAMPVVLLAVGSAYGIHLINNILLSKETDKLKLVKNSVINVGLAISMAALTTVAGFGSLASSSLIPIKHFGIFAAVGVFFALIVTLYFIPSIILLFGHKKEDFVIKNNKKEQYILNFLYNLVHSKNQLILIISALILAISIAGIFKVNTEMNLITFFHKNSEINISDKILNKKLAGTSVLNVIIESKDGTSIAKTEILSEIEKFQNEILKKFKIVRKVVSINDYLKKMNKEMFGSNEKYYTIPDSDKKISDYLILYSGNLEPYITPERDKIRISLSLERVSTIQYEKIKKFIEEYFKTKKEKFNVNVIITGIADIYTEVNKVVVYGQVSSLILALIIVFLINFFVFKNLILSLISIVPIVLSLAINFGLLGFLKIPLNAGTAMIASVAIGIGIDYAIHFIVKYRIEREQNEIDTAIKKTFEETGQAIFYNMFAVAAGFLVLIFSKFVPLFQFGILVAFNMIVTGLGALLVIPSLLKFYKNKKFNFQEV